jgi:hypothetical protein
MKAHADVEVYLHHSWPGYWINLSAQFHASAALPPEPVW